MNLKHQGPHYIIPEELLEQIDLNDSEQLRMAMISAAFYIDDSLWLQERFIELIRHEDPWVRKVSATCFAHVARIHGGLDVARVRPLIERLLDDPATVGHAEDALEDIDMLYPEST